MYVSCLSHATTRRSRKPVKLGIRFWGPGRLFLLAFRQVFTGVKLVYPWGRQFNPCYSGGSLGPASDRRHPGMPTRPALGRSTSSIPNRQTPFRCDNVPRRNAENGRPNVSGHWRRWGLSPAVWLPGRRVALPVRRFWSKAAADVLLPLINNAIRVSIWRVMSLSCAPIPSMSRLCRAPVVASSLTSC
jgi:hypothetical protein